MSYDKRDYPPIECDCGCVEKEVRNEHFEDAILVEYDLHCKECGSYLGHFAYGNWSY